MTLLELAEKNMTLEKLTYRRGQRVFSKGDVINEVFIVLRGVVNICSHRKGKNGNRLILGIRTAGDLLNEFVFSDDNIVPSYEAIVTENGTLVVSISSTELFRHAKQDLGIFGDLIRQISKFSHETQELAERLCFCLIAEKVCLKLLELEKSFAVETEEGTLLNLKLTHFQLAEMVGATRENVTTFLNQLQKKGILKLKRYKITICDWSALKKIAGLVQD